MPYAQITGLDGTWTSIIVNHLHYKPVERTTFLFPCKEETDIVITRGKHFRFINNKSIMA